MADNTIIHYSGEWIFHNGAPATGALLYVYNEDTLDLATIYSDRDLGSTRANPIEADANGLMPFAYIGTQAYKVILRTSAGVLIDEEDDLPGALNTTPFAAATFGKPDTDVTSKTSDYTLVEADLGGIFNGTCTGGTVQFTLLSAVTASNGRGFTIRHNGTANYVKIVSVSSQTISRPATGVTTTGFALVGYGESVTLVSDGANWHVSAYVPPLITAATGIITTRDRVNAAPVGPNPGDRYIVTGAFSTFEQEDVIEADGQGNYIEYTPPTDCGWVAFVQDENLYYRFFDSAWVPESATDTVRGTAEIAVQSEMETATDTERIVSPGRQHFHPGHPKFWAMATVSGATPTLQTSYNVTSITDAATGRLTVTIATDFSSANWNGQATMEDAAGGAVFGTLDAGTIATGSVDFQSFSVVPSLVDPTSWHVMGLGDQT